MCGRDKHRQAHTNSEDAVKTTRSCARDVIARYREAIIGKMHFANIYVFIRTRTIGHGREELVINGAV